MFHPEYALSFQTKKCVKKAVSGTKYQIKAHIVARSIKLAQPRRGKEALK